MIAVHVLHRVRMCAYIVESIPYPLTTDECGVTKGSLCIILSLFILGKVSHFRKSG